MGEIPTSEGCHKEANMFQLPKSLCQTDPVLKVLTPGSPARGRWGRTGCLRRGQSGIRASMRTPRVPGRERARSEQEMEWSSTGARNPGSQLPHSRIRDLMWLQFPSGHKLFVFQRS